MVIIIRNTALIDKCCIYLFIISQEWKESFLRYTFKKGNLEKNYNVKEVGVLIAL